MANPIIQGYLSDESIPLDKRQNVLNAIKLGENEQALAGLITTKYGDKYARSFANNVAGNIAKGVTSAMRTPGSFATAAAPIAGEFLAAKGKDLSETTFPVEKIKPKVNPLTIAMKPGQMASDVLNTVGDVGFGAVKGFSEGAGNLIQSSGQVLDTVNPVNVFSRTTGIGEPVDVAQIATKPIQGLTQVLSDKTSDFQKAVLGRNPEGTANMVGEMVGLAGAEALAYTGAAPAISRFNKMFYSAKFPLLTSIAQFVLPSAESTTLAVAGAEGRLPTAQEYGIYGLVDLATLGLSKLGSKIYKSAFRGTKSQEANLVKSFGETVGDVAEKYGYTGNPNQIRDKAIDATQEAWKNLTTTAAGSKGVTRAEYQKMAEKIITDTFGDLPSSQFKQEAIEATYEALMKYAPVKSMNGQQIVATIASINKELFGDGSRIVLTPKQLNSIQADVKAGLKEFLPPEVAKSYQTYAENKLLSEVMANAEVKRLIGRATIGAGALGAASLAHSLSIGKRLDESLMDLISWAIGGAVAGALTGNTTLLTKSGAFLKLPDNPIIKTAIKSAIERLNAISIEEGEKVSYMDETDSSWLIPKANAAGLDEAANEITPESTQKSFADRFITNLADGGMAMFGPDSITGQLIMGAIDTVKDAPNIPGKAVVGMGKGLSEGITKTGEDLRDMVDAVYNEDLDTFTKANRVVGQGVEAARDMIFLPASAVGGGMREVPILKPVYNTISEGFKFIDDQLNELYGEGGAWQDSIEAIPNENVKQILRPVATFMQEAGTPIANTGVQVGGMMVLKDMLDKVISKKVTGKDKGKLGEKLDDLKNKYEVDSSLDLKTKFKSVLEKRKFLDQRFKEGGFMNKVKGKFTEPDSKVNQFMNDYSTFLDKISGKRDLIMESVKKSKGVVNPYDEANALFQIKTPLKPTLNGVPQGLVPYAKVLRDYKTVNDFIRDLNVNNVRGLPYYQHSVPATQLRLFDRLNEFTGSQYESAGAFYDAVKKPGFRADYIWPKSEVVGETFKVGKQ